MVPARLALAADGGTPESFGEHTEVSAGLAGIVRPAGQDVGGPGGPVAGQQVEVGEEPAGELDPVQAPMWFSAGTDDANAFVPGLLGWMLEGLDKARRAQALAALRATIDAHITTDGVVYGVAGRPDRIGYQRAKRW